MKKTIKSLLLIWLAFCLTMSAAAISPKATGGVETTVQPNSIKRIGTALSMEKDELVTINCTYSPRMADVDFGLITPQYTFIFVGGESGNCNQTIRINETGDYYFAVRNNSSNDVEVLGYVYY